MAERLPHITPKFESFSLSYPVNLLERDGDPRKAAYTVRTLMGIREYWHEINGRSPSIARLFQAEGLMEHKVVPAEDVSKAVNGGNSVKPRGDHYETRIHMAPEHLVTVIMGVEALTDIAQEQGFLDDNDRRTLLLAAALHDVNKDIEFTLTRMTINDETAGYGQAGYDLAGRISTQKLRFARVPEEVIDLHQVVGHTSCPDMEQQLTQANGTIEPSLLRQLIMHYVDDIVINPNIINPSITTDEEKNRLNALDRRCIQNENNQTYKKYNQAWLTDQRNKTGETAFTMQRRVGHLEENLIAKA